VERGIDRLIDGYAEGLIDKSEFEPRIRRLKQRAAALATQAQELVDAQALRRELAMIVGRLEEFAGRVEQGLDGADPATRREIIRAVVRRIEVDAGQVRVVFRVGPSPFVLRPGRGDLQHCPRRRDPAAME
jgi:site-specific DNA recombinase